MLARGSRRSKSLRLNRHSSPYHPLKKVTLTNNSSSICIVQNRKTQYNQWGKMKHLIVEVLTYIKWVLFLSISQVSRMKKYGDLVSNQRQKYQIIIEK